MSYITEVNPNDIINRLVDILSRSTLLFPKSKGGNKNATDLIKQVIAQDIPVTQDVPTGEGPPHLIVMQSANPTVTQRQMGRDDPDAKGPRSVTLEYWVIVVVNEAEFDQSQRSLNDIIHAATVTLGRNQRLTNAEKTDPKAVTLSYITTPYTNLESDVKTLMARTIVVRPEVIINLRPE